MSDLYRFYDAGGTLLYVGISLHAAQRASQHRDDKDWWPLVARMDIEHHTNRESAATAERKAIKEERPVHNIQHAPRPRHPETLRSAPRNDGQRWKVGVVYAFGLDNGECPVGLVREVWIPDEAYPFTTIELDLYNWGHGFFTAGTITIPAESVQESMRAFALREGREWVWQMDPLGDFQTRWQRRRQGATA